MYAARTPSDLDIPSYLMSFPFTVDNRYTNNPLMKAYKDTKYNYKIAFKQFMSLYTYLAKESIIYLLPSYGNFQDQVFTANLACYLPHMDNFIMLANFKSEPRKGEDKVGLDFFHKMGYSIIRPGHTWEGEADLKYIYYNTYIGGYGIRTQLNTYHWLMDLSGANVITIKMTDEDLYHFDCMFLPLGNNKALVATSAIQPADLRKLESMFEIFPVPKKYVYDAWTNSLKFNNKVLHGLVNQDSDENFVKVIEKTGLEPVIIDLSEFEKSGAALSCMIMHLNYKARG